MKKTIVINEEDRTYITPDMPIYNKLKYKIGDVNEDIKITKIFKARANGKSRIYVEVFCKCKKVTFIEIFSFGRNKSCGCAHKKVMSTHSLYKENGKIVTAYHNMMRRCYDKTNQNYKDYGGRGIIVEAWWNEVGVDKAILIARFVYWCRANGWDNKLSIDRINVNGNYSPFNCKFSTRKEQARNRRNSIMVTAFNETKTYCEWLEDDRCVATPSSLYDRLKKKWDPETAITTPSRRVSNEEVHEEVIELYKSKKSKREIGRLTGISCGYIGKIIKNFESEKTIS